MLLFDCPEETAEGRVLTRRVGREGDTCEVFRRRYKEFTELNPGVLRYYRDKGLLVKVRGNRYCKGPSNRMQIDTSGGIEDSYTGLLECLRDRGYHEILDGTWAANGNSPKDESNGASHKGSDIS